MKILFSILLIFVVAGCKPQGKEIRIAEKEYTAAEMTRFLEHVFKGWSGGEKQDFHTLPTDGSDIVYELNVTGNLNKEKIHDILHERFTYFSSLTGLNFRLPNDEQESVNIFFFLGEGAKEIENLPNMQAIKAATDLPIHDFYKNFININRKKNTKPNLFFQGFTGKKTKTSKRYLHIFPAVLIREKEWFQEEENLNYSLSNTIMVLLLNSGVGPKISSNYAVQESALTLNKREFPYIWELDKLLLKIIYEAEDELSGMPNKYVVSYIIDKLIRSHGK